MPSTPFPRLHEVHPPAGPRAAFDEARHGAIAAKVPPMLADEWRSFGFGAYGDGLLWIAEPDRPVLDPKAWSQLDGTGIEVLRTAFASICVWQKEKFVWLNVHTGNAVALTDEAELLFCSSLIEPNFRRDVLRESLFRKLRRRLGPLEAADCYGFSPLPAAGGSSSEAFAIKISLREYVARAARALSDRS